MRKITTTFLLFFFVINIIYAQSDTPWNGKKCAVVLTYDDALNVHLDSVMPVLDKHHFNGTFYVMGDTEILNKRMEEWRKASKKGHELGNHTLAHPCDGSIDHRDWVIPERDLSKYTIFRAVNEIKTTNTLLKAIDGKDERTFAYPCGDLTINGTTFYDQVESEFVAARGTFHGLESSKTIDMNNIKCFSMHGQTGEEMIKLVQEAEAQNALVVFLFHGVGGEHSLNVSNDAHIELIEYLSKHKKDIWVDTMVEIARYLKNKK
ncbi:polysaccharide deacetylase family protein [Flammeovirga sp. SJP92]|uniref:polysaccharide deacetylase family protein n=1 Tax=Flammeovirga sp. SJP92 TaxID=1775430 RepID=UPI00078746B0|nr:polysaccharide deacetylase family protein [Flammeovirga sp. SJP92]KXX71493.1 chitooligosaccharide deacetylase [Flammeovirga sp. SJP92]